MAFRTLLPAVILFAVLPSTESVQADDWPRWFGPHGDDTWRESGLLEKFPPAGPPVTWRVPVKPGYSGPAVARGRIYLMDFARRKRRDGEDRRTVFGTERVLCLSTENGQTLWEHSTPAAYRVSYPEGPRTTPTVDGDRVYTLGTMGQLNCFDAETGEVIWSKSLPRVYDCKPPVWGYAIHPIVDGENLICAVGADGAALVALNKHNGAEVWKSLTVKEIGYAPPVFIHEGADRQLVFWHDVAVVGLNPATGSQLWRVEFPVGKEPIPQQPATPIATPRIAGSRVLISAYFDGSLLLDVSTAPPAARVVWMSPGDDMEHKDDLASLMTTPVIDGDHFYGISGDGELRCLSMDSQELLWRSLDWVGGKQALFGTAFFVRNGDRYFTWTDQGELLLVRLTPEGYDEISRASILKPTFGARGRKVTWSHPAFSDGRMYARNFEELVCVDLRAGAESAEPADGAAN